MFRYELRWHYISGNFVSKQLCDIDTMTLCVTSNHLRSFIWSHRMFDYITGSQSLSVSNILYTDILSNSRTLSFAWTHFIFQTRLEVQISFQTSGCLNCVNYYGISQDLSNNRAGGGQDKSTVWSTVSEVLILTASRTSTGEFLGEFFSIFEVDVFLIKSKVQIEFW